MVLLKILGLDYLFTIQVEIPKIYIIKKVYEAKKLNKLIQDLLIDIKKISANNSILYIIDIFKN